MSVDIEVGSGPVTKSSIWIQVASGLTALSAFLTTITGNLPEGIDPSVGLGITVAGGVIATLSQLVLALGRGKFAEAKAKVMAGQSAYGVIEEMFEDQDEEEEIPLVDFPEKSDTDLEPTVEP